MPLISLRGRDCLFERRKQNRREVSFAGSLESYGSEPLCLWVSLLSISRFFASHQFSTVLSL
jgi:hypothetical protein